MKNCLKNWLQPVWLLAFLSVCQISFGQFVLCVEEDGHVSIETSLCACHSMSKVVVDSEAMDNAETHQCGPCKDITTAIDTLRTASQEHLLHYLLPIVITHPESKIQHVDLIFAKAYLPIPHPHSSLHPSISATILLI